MAGSDLVPLGKLQLCGALPHVGGQYFFVVFYYCKRVF